MPDELTRTPVTIDFINDEHVVFVGTVEKKVEHESLFGTHESKYKYPSVMLSREYWENINRPVQFMLVLEEFSNG